MGTNSEPNNSRIRWWAAAIIFLLDAGVVSWIWIVFDSIRQQKVLGTLAVQVITLLLLVLWLLLLSRLRWKIRLTTLAGLVVLLALFFFLFPFKEFTGDLVPTFGWRWAEKSFQTEIMDINTDSETDNLFTSPAFSYPPFLGPERIGCSHPRDLPARR